MANRIVYPRNPMLRARAGSSNVRVGGDDLGVSRSRLLWLLILQCDLRTEVSSVRIDGAKTSAVETTVGRREYSMLRSIANEMLLLLAV